MGTPEMKGMPIEILLVTFFAEYLNLSLMVPNCNIYKITELQCTLQVKIFVKNEQVTYLNDIKK